MTRLLPEEVEGYAGTTICRKSPADAAVAMVAVKCYQMWDFLHWVLAVANIKCFGGWERLVFKIK
jgi:hypothetical protein